MGLFSGLAQFAGVGSWNSFRDNWITGIAPLRAIGLWPKKADGITPDYSQSGSSHVFKSATAKHQAIYGQIRVSGLKYEIGSTGANNEYLHMVIVLAGHEIDSIGNIIIDNKLVNGTAVTAIEKKDVAAFANSVRVKRHLGGAGQVADPDLVAEFAAWTANHVGAGIAYVYLRLKYNAALFPNGVSNIKVDVRGKKVFDPRNQSFAWSDNWALCMRDYLTSDYGLGLLDSEINDTFTISAANIAQQVIPTANGGQQNRYTLNGVVDLSKKPLDNIKKMLTAGAGHIVPVMEGKARIIAGAYIAPEIVNNITVSDLRADLTYSPHQSITSLFNTVTGTYAGEESGWVKVSYPQVGSQAAVTADGKIIKKAIDLPYCTDHERCQRISKLVLAQHRSSATLKLSCKATVKNIAAMDVVNVSIPYLWAGNKTFRVMDFTSNPDLTVDLMLEEDLLSDYDWVQGDAVPFVPTPPALTNTSPGIVQPGIPVRVNGLELAGQGNNTEFTGGDAHFVWRHTTVYDYQNLGSEIFGAGSGGFDAWFMGYEITILDTTGTVLRTDFTRDNFYDFTFLKNAYSQGGPYRAFKIEVRIKGQQNQLSQAATLSVSNPAPALPTGLATIPSFDNIHITFVRPADLDFAGVEVYLSTVSGFTPSLSTRVVTSNSDDIVLPGLISGTVYYIRIKPFDDFGKDGTNISGEIAVTCTAVSGMVIEPGSIDYITLTPIIAANIQAVPGVSTTANTAFSTANSAATTATGAQSTANSATLTANTAFSTANSAATTATGAQSTANSATLTANTAFSTANSAATTATSAQSTANSATLTANTAVTDAVGAQATASTALTATTNINGKLAASYAVRLKVGTNAVVGFGLTDGTGATSSFDIIASQFRLADANGGLANAAFSVDAQGNAEFTGNLKAAGGTFTGAITGGTINIGTNFNVNGAGSMVATNATLSGALTAGAGSVIDGLHITDATIDTLKIAGESATFLRDLYSAGAQAVVQITLLHPASVLVMGSSQFPAASAPLSISYKVAGSPTWTQLMAGGSPPRYTIGNLSRSTGPLPAGTYDFQCFGQSATTLALFVSIR